eukprot:SAG11_NODE_22160_length_411_cov_0.663462_1_plen_33_part_10
MPMPALAPAIAPGVRRHEAAVHVQSVWRGRAVR